MRSLAVAAAMMLVATAGAVAAAPRVDATTRVQQLAQSDAVRAKVRGGLLLYFAPRPSLDGSRRVLPARERAPVWLTLHGVPSALDVQALESLGVDLDRHLDGTLWLLGGRTLHGELSAHDLVAVASLPQIRRITFDGAPFGVLRPLDVTAAEIEAPAVWRTEGPGGALLTGAGVTVCDSDSGIDVFHPAFFRADGGYYDWVDVDGSGDFDADIDGVDLGDAGTVTLRVLNGIITNGWDETPLFGSQDPAFDLGLDWLYADQNGDAERNHGAGVGFTDDSPGFGEPLLLVDDVDGNGRLDVDEKLVMLGSSKIAAVRFDGQTFRRGQNLIHTPRDEEISHGTGASGVIASGQRGLSRKVGMAPGVDLLMARSSDGGNLGGLTQWCIDEGARVVLHEYAPWYGYHLDGSSEMEQLIDDSSLAPKVAHINPAGNLSTSQKLYKHQHPAAATTTIVVSAAADNPYAPFAYVGLTLLWRDVDRKLSVVLEDPTGFSKQLPVDEDTDYGPWTGPLLSYAERVDSDRGTARLDVFVFEPDLAAPIPTGDWLLHITDPAAPGEPDLEVIAYVADDASGWGMGIHFPDHASEDHLIGWPGTADRGIAVAAYSATAHTVGAPGERAYYSGRGYRIDGEEILSISGPADPIVPDYVPGSEARYFIYGGTSGASPHVAGTAALLLQHNPALDGVDVRQAIRDGALADANVGAAPNHDWGYGKLRAHRSIFGEPPPSGAPPTVLPLQATLTVGETRSFEVTVSDPEDAPSSIVVEIDRDYDGSYDETLPLSGFAASFSASGHYVSKLRATDPTGRSGTALAIFEVTGEAPPEPPPVPEDADLVHPDTLLTGRGGGCLCATPAAPSSLPGSLPRGGWLAALGLVTLLGRRRRAQS